MKKLLQTLYLTVSLIGVTPAHADDMLVMGPGTMSCRQYITALRVAGTGTASKIIDGTFFAWAQGFMSASNVARTENGVTTKNLNAVDPTEQEQQLRNYCFAHPQKNYADGMAAMFESLPDSTEPVDSNND